MDWTTIRLGVLLVVAAGGTTLAASATAPGARRAHATPRGAAHVRARRLRPEAAPHSALVRVRPGVDARTVLAAHGLRLVRRIPHTPYVVAATRAQTTRAAVRALVRDPRVVRAGPNRIRYLFAEPNDRLYAKAHDQGYLETVRAPEAWDRATDCSGATVAVVDDGIDATNVDLAGRVLPQHVVTAGDGVHGTRVAGVIAAAGNNGVGIAGVCWKAKILPVVVAGPNGEATDADVATGVTWAADNGATVINLSLGAPGSTDVLKAAIDYALSKNVVVVAAAGNAGDPVPEYPAAYPGVVAVAGTDWDGKLASFSSWGSWVDLAAPAVDIVTTAPTAFTTSSFAITEGTSFSAPLVAGAAALVRTQNPSWPQAQVVSRLEQTARDAGQLGVDDHYGYGIVDIAAATGAPAAERVLPLAGDANEPNDAPRRATPLAVGSSAAGTLEPEGDTDWYRVDVSAQENIDIDAGFTSAEVAVFGPDLGELADRYWFSAWPLSFSVPAAAPGPYYIRVSSRYGAVRDYTLTVHASPLGDWNTWRWLPETPDRSSMRKSGVAVADVTGDAMPDVVVSTTYGDPPEANSLLVYAQRRDGTLTAPTIVPGSAVDGCCAGVVAADVDGDGRSDLLVRRRDDVQVFFQRNGTVTAGPVVAAPQTYDVVAADLNGDRRADAVVDARGGLSVALSNGAGFSPPTTIDSVPAADVATGDVNGDGRVDVVAAPGGYTASLTLYLQTAGGTFTQTTVPGPSFAIGPFVNVAAGDFTGDGRTDVVAVASGGDPSQLVLYPQTSSGALGTPVEIGAGLEFTSVLAADANGDGRTDVAALSYSSSGDATTSLFLQANGTLSRPREVPIGGGGNGAGELAVADVNGDGASDLVNTASVVLRRTAWHAPAAWVADATPASGSTGVATAVRPTVTFGRTVDAASVTAATVYVADTHGNRVPATVAYDAASRTATVTATATLAAASAYTLEVDGVRDNGGTTATHLVATRFFTGTVVDSTPPDTFINGTPRAGFEFAATEPAVRFECAVDGGGFGPCGPLPTSDARHTLLVRAVDRAGNVDPSPARTTWRPIISGSPPPNHEIPNAVVITGSSGAVTASNNFFSGWDLPNPAGSKGGHEVWYRWTAPSSGTVTFDTNGSDFDTVLGVYTGTDVTNLATVAEDDDTAAGDLAASVSFAATAGTTYLVDVDGFGDWRDPYDQDVGTFNLTWAARGAGAAPSNDAFASATALAGATGSATGDTTTATREAGEPLIVGNAGGHSVWFAWTAQASGAVTVDTTGSAFDTTLAVYTGSSLGALTKLAENDDQSATVTQSKVAFTATAGTTYRIQLDGYNGTSRPPWYGAYKLNWSGPVGGGGGGGAAPPNDAFANAQALSGATGSATGDTSSATREAGEPTIVGNAGGHSVWFTVTPAASGSVTLDTHGSAFDTTLAVYTGSSVTGLTKVVENDDSSSADTTSTVTFVATGGTTYRVQVDGYNGTSRPPWYGAYKLSWTGPSGGGGGGGTPPPNDAFANAVSLSATTGTASGDTTYATREAGEPTIVGNAGGHSVWLALTPTASGSVTLDTHGSAFDTTLAVYTGSSLAGLTKVAENDDSSSTDTTSAVTFSATAGTTYRVQVDGYNGTSRPPWYGAYKLNWSTAAAPPPPPAPPPGPANDGFANAAAVTTSATGDTTNATRETGEPTIVGNAGGHSVWFTWTPSASGTATVDTLGSAFDTTLAVYTGSTLTALTKLAENDDTSATVTQSTVTFAATAGTTYRIQLDGYYGTSRPPWYGTYKLNVRVG